ncbi:transcriptional regulator Spx [Virgibacillus profundi]|uniref:Transcriptional regulator Spx n=1 Tax=Virgibacillus profundi TaxID=2024555 RepID=A0A2A2I9L4_9BACI|nr:transcriptional regulator Spx [Virgibacillus profundi]PAV27964.1 transcriptional regulator Spx [Virgibacillus profundi]PXY52142.1 transcriptional regulator Spx [Virgibacillus profundi]
MLRLYVTPGCTSCRKARVWLQENNLPFVERNTFSEPLTLPEIKGIFRLTDNGTEDIISTRSKIFQKNIGDMDQLSLNVLYSFIQENPSILRSPIIHDEKRLMVGYSKSQIRRFLPRSVRSLQLHDVY